MSNDMSSETNSAEHFQSSQEGWAELRTISNPKEYARLWLESQVKQIGNEVHQAVVVLSSADQGAFVPAAIWPEGSMGNPALVTSIETSIKNSATFIQESTRSGSSASKKQRVNLIALPLMIEGKVCGAIGLEVDHSSRSRQQQIAAQIDWGSAWLESLLVRNKLKLADRLVGAVELTATALAHDRFQAAATAVATELAGMLSCERVSISFISGKRAKIAVISHSAGFGKKANVVRAIEAAMDEAIDQQATIVYPGADKSNYQVTRAHQELVDEHHAGEICTVPLAQGKHMLGAITLERPKDMAFDTTAVELSEHVALLLGPILDVKRKDDRWLIRKAIDSGKDTAGKIFGPRHVGLKLVTGSLALLVLFFSVAKGDYRVAVDGRIEGAVQRAISTPIAGYISQANYRAGDRVKAGDELFVLDDRELKLELVKWTSQKSQYSREYTAAVASHNRARASVLQAQVDQAAAQIALVEEQLSRIRGVAPYDSIVVSGDLSQSLGAPVERGDVLFEIAPLDDYRVILEVEERDVTNLAVGQTGVLVLTGLSENKLEIVVEKITPVAIAEEGVNFFRVEASFSGESPANLRPGMEGVAKVTVEKRKLIWIWTHKVSHWLRMFFWSWWP